MQSSRYNKNLKTVDQYIVSFPKDVGEKLKTIRAIIKKAAPQAEEKISYGMPGYKLGGMLVYFAAWKNHVALYAMPSGVKAFQKELQKYETSKSTIQFPLNKPLPTALITKMVKFRVQENMAKVKPVKKSAASSYNHYHKDGSIWAKGNHAKNKMDGYWEWFRKDGTKMRSGYFTNGVQTGKWTTYDQKGKVYKVTDFKSGRKK